MLGRLWGLFRRDPIPYHANLDTLLLRFGGRDRFTIRDACEGVQVFGGVGSGKTSGSGSALLRAYLKAGMGGMVCCAKPDEADRIRELAKACGRERDLVFLDSSGRQRFNFLDYAQATIARGGFDTNLVELLTKVAEATRMQSGQGGGGKEDQYFRDAANELLSHALPFLRVAQGTIRLKDLHRFILEAPTSHAEAVDPDFVKRSFCAQSMLRVAQKAKAGDREAMRVADEYGGYWTSQFPGIADKQRAAIVSTLTSSIYPFLSGQLHKLFCTDTTITPEFARQGIIIVLDLPARQFGGAGIVAQHIFKLLWQYCMDGERIRSSTRPVFAWLDEAQFFMNSHDADHLSVSRQQRVCNVYLTQDMPTYYARIGNENTAEAVLNKFGTRIFHATTDAKTTHYAAEMIGKVKHYNESVTQGTSDNVNDGSTVGPQGQGGSGGKGGGNSRTHGRSSYMDYDIAPDYFGRELRTGGPPNRNRVDAIIVRGNRKFRSSRRNRIKAEFRQS